ncbi:MAG: hypothetical protein HC824_19695 [Synechococcales cyanobacterium RM1_1_8]|nr:hypothetical protein [Synechococcales cyanobacterium RM1_1_8]
MGQPVQSPAPVPALPSAAQPHPYSNDQAQLLQHSAALVEAVRSHSPQLQALADQSLQGWFNCRQAADATNQAALSALERATHLEAETAQLNRSIHRQLRMFDRQLKIASVTLHQEVAQKVGQVHRHIQQQSNHCRNRLNLDADQRPSYSEAHRSQVNRLFVQRSLQTQPCSLS